MPLPIRPGNNALSEVKTDRDFEESASSWRPIYCKTVDIGALPNTTTKSVAHSISNISTVVNQYGRADNGTVNWPLPYVSTAASSQAGIAVTSTNIDVFTGTDRSSYSGSVTVEYTKTTDTPTSSPRYPN